MAEVHEEVARVATAAEKLLHETERLRRDVAMLSGRIEPFDGEPKLPAYFPERMPLRNLKDALWIIEQARREIEGCERHLSSIRGAMDVIVSDAMLRDEMKPFIKAPPHRNRGPRSEP